MTLVNVNPTISEDYKKFMHVDHEESIVYDSYIIEFEYDPTCNYYKRGNMVVEIFMLLNYLSLCWDCQCFIHLLCICFIFIVFIICFLIKFLCIGSMLDLNLLFTCFIMLSLCFNSRLLCEHHQYPKPILMAIKKELVGRQPYEYNLFLPFFLFLSVCTIMILLWLCFLC